MRKKVCSDILPQFRVTSCLGARDILPHFQVTSCPGPRDILPTRSALPHKNLPLSIPLRLSLSGFRRRCPEATSVPMTSGSTTSHELYS